MIVAPVDDAEWGPAAHVGEDQSRVLPPRRVLDLPIAVIAEGLNRNRSKRDRATATRSLGFYEDKADTAPMLESSPDRQSPSIQVDVLPFESERLPHSEAGGCQQYPENV